MRFGISTHLYHDQRLSRAHLAQIAEYGFDAIEVFATRSHFDYHDPAAIAELAEWLKDTGLALHGIHAPITDRLDPPDRWGDVLSNAVTDNARRQSVVREAAIALNIAREIPTEVFVVHLGTPDSLKGENNRAAAFRSVEEICRLAEPIDIRVALEVIPNSLSDPGTLVELIERDLDAPRTGICLDFGHAHLDGDLVEAVETVSEHLIATHVHDNRGRTDDHLVPFDGTIDWPAALTAIQKVGYEGTLLLEIAAHGSPKDTLQKARKARERMERLLVT